MRQQNKLAIFSILLGLLLLPLTLLAELPSDKNAKLYITSDTAELNKTTGISIFIGNVKVDHGTTHVTADKLTTYNNKQSQIIKAIAEGSNGHLATYQTMTAPNKPPLNASALVIQYFPPQHYVILLGQATATQGKDSITGPRLEYDVAKQLLLSKTLPGTSSGRTTIVIQPDEMDKQ